MSLPSFLIGILLILILSVLPKWRPGFGRGKVVASGAMNFGLLTWDGIQHPLPPASTLALFPVVMVLRLVPSALLELLRTDDIKFARARGLPDRSVYFGHALKNILLPVITIAGLQLGGINTFHTAGHRCRHAGAAAGGPSTDPRAAR